MPRQQSRTAPLSEYEGNSGRIGVNCKQFGRDQISTGCVFPIERSSRMRPGNDVKDWSNCLTLLLQIRTRQKGEPGALPPHPAFFCGSTCLRKGRKGW